MNNWDEAFAVLSAKFDGYERREGQLQLAEAVAGVLARGGSLVAEAGTGTGKTFAYLVPLLTHAAQTGERVIVSTGTIALQEQILNQDLPRLEGAVPPYGEVALVKGKSNYLCRMRLLREHQSIGLFPPEGWTELMQWQSQTKTGDRAEIAACVPSVLWSRVAVDETCLRPYCPFQGECFFVAAREQAFRARVLVMNHHLYMSDLKVKLASGGEAAILPEHQIAVFDEAHHLPEIAAEAFTVESSYQRFSAWGYNLRRQEIEGLNPGLVQEVENAAAAFFSGMLLQVKGEVEARPLTSFPYEAAGRLRSHLKTLVNHLDTLTAQQPGVLQREAASRAFKEAEALRSDLNFILEGEEGYVSWFETRLGNRVILKATPLEVGGLLQEHLFSGLRSCVATSATLSTTGDFRFFRRETGLKSGTDLTVGSPFDFASQCLLYLPRDLPEPNQPGFISSAAERIRDLLIASRGRGLVLFTSYRGLNMAYDRLSGQLPFPVYRQGDMSRRLLLKTFQSEIDSVLLATVSFWEGIDIAGESLSCLIIDRLPFAVPGHPVTQARLEALKASGKDGFTAYSLPQAVLKLKQGFGRLIRSRHDRGVVAVLDRRVALKSYGRRFLDALPPVECTDRLEKVRAFFESPPRETLSGVKPSSG